MDLGRFFMKIDTLTRVITGMRAALEFFCAWNAIATAMYTTTLE